MGELSGGDDVVVNGHFEGTLRVDRRVTVGPDGNVHGQIHAREVVVLGRVDGDIFASERAEMTGSASVFGNVHSPKIVIAEGAKLEGSVAMSGAETPVKPAGKSS